MVSSSESLSPRPFCLGTAALRFGKQPATGGVMVCPAAGTSTGPRHVQVWHLQHSMTFVVVVFNTVTPNSCDRVQGIHCKGRVHVPGARARAASGTVHQLCGMHRALSNRVLLSLWYLLPGMNGFANRRPFGLLVPLLAAL